MLYKYKLSKYLLCTCLLSLILNFITKKVKLFKYIDKIGIPMIEMHLNDNELCLLQEILHVFNITSVS